MPNNMKETEVNMAPEFHTLKMQSQGINSIHSAVSEFIDNSMDANADHIYIKSVNNKQGKFDLFISDNGDGMTYEKLITISKVGASRKEGQANFGCRGVGQKNAACKLSKTGYEVYTKTENCNKINYSKFDIDDCLNRQTDNDWNSLYAFEEKELDGLKDEEVYDHFKHHSKGTIVKISCILRAAAKSKKDFDKKVTSSEVNIRTISKIYRHLIYQDKVSLFYNDSKLKPKGHGFEHKVPYQDFVFFSDMHKDGWIEHTIHPWTGGVFDCRFRFIRVASKSTLGTNSSKGGLEILRLSREVTGKTLSRFDKNYDLGHLIIEYDAEAEFLDECLISNGDKTINSLAPATDKFDLGSYLGKLFKKKYYPKIIAINREDSFEKGSKADQKNYWNHQESILRDRLYQTFKNSLTLLGQSEDEVSDQLTKEYKIPGTEFRLDLVCNDIPYEVKVSHNDPTKSVGQVLSYIPWIVKDKTRNFVKNGKVKFVLAIGSKETSSLKKHIKMINDSYFVKIDDELIGVNIVLHSIAEKNKDIIDAPLSLEEKNKSKNLS